MPSKKRVAIVPEAALPQILPEWLEHWEHFATPSP